MNSPNFWRTIASALLLNLNKPRNCSFTIAIQLVTYYVVFQEREIEPMDVGEPIPPVKSTAPVSANQQHQQQQKEHPVEVAPVDPSPSTQCAAKPQKSVSFEDNDGYHENDDDHNESSRSVQLKRKQLKQQSKESKKSESADSSDGLVTYLRRKQLKHQQHVAASQQGAGGDGSPETLEIGNKKDRRHRSGMKSNGLFGPEGMWQNKFVGYKF